MRNIEELKIALNARSKEERLDAVQKLKNMIDRGEIPAVPRKDECNNHVHSFYSFSPYSPSMIAWKAYESGLATCGIVDHESVAGCLEFAKACEILGIIPTLGFELRMNCDNTPLKGKRLNNQDQLSVGYFPVHGLPLCSIDKVEELLKPIRHARAIRNRKMTDRVNETLQKYDIQLDFDNDVVPVSMWHDCGEITERHILYATANKMIQRFGKGQPLMVFLEEELNIPLSARARGYLSDTESTIYAYDLTNVLKGFFSTSMYVDTTAQETPDVKEVLPYLNSLGCIPTYIYLGDIRGESTTGDRKSQKFEDDILDELFQCFYEYGLRAISYVPSRNDEDQVVRIRELCAKYGMLEICGEDINQPRQGFICQQKCEEDRVFFNDSTWALVGHEKLANKDLTKSIISPETTEKMPDLKERMFYYKKIGFEETDTLL